MQKNTGSSKTLAENIKAAMSPGEATSTNKGQYGIASLASDMSKSLGDNTEVIQNIINEQGDQTRDEFVKLVKLMTSSQTKRGEELQRAVGEIIKQVAKLKLSAGDRGEELEKNLGLDRADKKLNKGSWLKEKFNVDQNKTGLGAILQAFSPNSMFGSTFNKTPNLQKQAGLEFQQERQASALGAVNSSLFTNTKNSNTNNANTTNSNTTSKQENVSTFKSGIDATSELEKQTGILKEILEQLYEVEDAAKSSSGSVLAGLGTMLGGLGLGAGLSSVKTLVSSALSTAGGMIKNVATGAVNAGKSIFSGVQRASTAVSNATVTAGKSISSATRAVGPRLMSTARVLGNVASKVAAPLTLAMSAYDTYKTSTDDYAERFGFDPVRGNGFGDNLKELGIRGLGAASDIGNTLTAGIAGDYLFQDKKSKAAAANEGVSITQAQTGTVDRSNPVQSNSSASSAEIAKEEPSKSNPVPVAIVSSVERAPVLPTATAVENITANSSNTNNNMPPIINNIINNTTNPTNTPILTVPATVRNDRNIPYRT